MNSDTRLIAEAHLQHLERFLKSRKIKPEYYIDDIRMLRDAIWFIDDKNKR